MTHFPSPACGITGHGIGDGAQTIKYPCEDSSAQRKQHSTNDNRYGAESKASQREVHEERWNKS